MRYSISTTRLLVFLLTALFGVTGPAAGQAVTADHGAAIGASEWFIDSLMEAEGIPGLSVAVGLDGEVVWSRGFGFADLENRVPVTPLTKFRVGSVSKTLTAAALARLVEEGRLDLDAPIQRYLPNFPAKSFPITTRQLAGHLGGIRHYRGMGSVTEGQRAYRDVMDALAIFADDTLLHPPGTKYAYSSYGWNLISAIVQSAAERPFLEYMDAEVFGPLGMRHTIADYVDSIIPFRTQFYSRRRDGTVQNAVWVNNSYKWAGGGFLSNTEDLIRFAFAHRTAGYLQAETIEMLWTSQRTTDGTTTGYGMGWRTGQDRAGRWWVGHGGSSVGGRTQLVMYPDHGLVVAITANSSNAPMTTGVAGRIAGEFLRGR